MKAYRFKLYKSERNEKLNKQINAAGLIYNHCIALHKRYYKIFGKHLNKNHLQKHLVKIKKIIKFSYIKEIGSQAVQDITDRIDKAYFKKVNRYKSFKLKQKAGWKLDENTYTLKVNGQNYRYFRSQSISGKVKTVMIKRDSLGEFYVCIVTDAKDFVVETRTGNSVGFDFGLKKFLTASDGKDIISSLFFAQNSVAIKKLAKIFHAKRKVQTIGKKRF